MHCMIVTGKFTSFTAENYDVQVGRVEYINEQVVETKYSGHSDLTHMTAAKPY